jgi:cytochrome c553
MAVGKVAAKKAVKKGSELTERQKKTLQKELDEVQAGKSRGKTLEEVEKSYTPAEIRQMERELEKIKKSAQGMAKGGKVTKMARGGGVNKMMGGGYGTRRGMK